MIIVSRFLFDIRLQLLTAASCCVSFLIFRRSTFILSQKYVKMRFSFWTMRALRWTRGPPQGCLIWWWNQRLGTSAKTQRMSVTQPNKNSKLMSNYKPMQQINMFNKTLVNAIIIKLVFRFTPSIIILVILIWLPAWIQLICAFN